MPACQSMPMVDETYRVVVIGDGAVGKTILIQTFDNGKPLTESYEPTTYNNEYKLNRQFIVDEEAVDITVWDTAGQEDWADLRKKSYEGADAFVICFCPTDKNRDSFENVRQQWIKEIPERFRKYTRSEKNPIILVSTKCDLLNDEEHMNDFLEGGDELPTEREIDELRVEIGASTYVHCSGKMGVNVEAVFVAAVRAGKEFRKKSQSDLNAKCTIL